MRFTLFHALVLVGLLAGAILGTYVGPSLFGMHGKVLGALVGVAVGFAVGQLPKSLVLELLVRRLELMRSDELRTYLRDPDCLTPNCVLLELQRRGEDIAEELPVILEMLVSKDIVRRFYGWAALKSAFPEVARKFRDYHARDPIHECRTKAGTSSRGEIKISSAVELCEVSRSRREDHDVLNEKLAEAAT
jgi:hypothetical protein